MLADLFKMCFQECCFPAYWKVSLDRYMWLLTLCCVLTDVEQILGKLGNNKLADHLEQCCLFCIFHCGFWLFRSTSGDKRSLEVFHLIFLVTLVVLMKKWIRLPSIKFKRLPSSFKFACDSYVACITVTILFIIVSIGLWSSPFPRLSLIYINLPSKLIWHIVAMSSMAPQPAPWMLYKLQKRVSGAVNPLSANPQKWSSTLKQFVGNSRIVWISLTTLGGWLLNSLLTISIEPFGHSRNVVSTGLFDRYYSGRHSIKVAGLFFLILVPVESLLVILISCIIFQ